MFWIEAFWLIKTSKSEFEFSVYITDIDEMLFMQIVQRIVTFSDTASSPLTGSALCTEFVDKSYTATLAIWSEALMVLITQYGSDGTSLFFAPLLDVYVSAKLVDALKAENKSAPFSAGPAVIVYSD